MDKIIPIKLSVTICYLIKADHGYVLIDTGYEEDWDLFQVGIKAEGITLSQISHIILTHHHDDHCGLLLFVIWMNTIGAGKMLFQLEQAGFSQHTASFLLLTDERRI